jgi:hypothetical protein
MKMELHGGLNSGCKTLGGVRCLFSSAEFAKQKEQFRVWKEEISISSILLVIY